MKECKFIRKNHLIWAVQDEKLENVLCYGGGGKSSINAAKRESRRLQPILGDGTLRVDQPN